MYVKTQKCVADATIVKVWCIQNNAHWRYKHFLCHGKMLKMTILSRPRRWSDQKDFNNFSCHRSEEHPQQISWHSERTCRRSLVKCGVCLILVISCLQEGALWVWPNFYIWMASGQASYHAHKVSCRLDNVQWSYKHLIFLGKMLKMLA